MDQQYLHTFGKDDFPPSPHTSISSSSTKTNQEWTEERSARAYSRFQRVSRENPCIFTKLGRWIEGNSRLFPLAVLAPLCSAYALLLTLLSDMYVSRQSLFFIFSICVYSILQYWILTFMNPGYVQVIGETDNVYDDFLMKTPPSHSQIQTRIHPVSQNEIEDQKDFNSDSTLFHSSSQVAADPNNHLSNFLSSPPLPSHLTSNSNLNNPRSNHIYSNYLETSTQLANFSNQSHQASMLSSSSFSSLDYSQAIINGDTQRPPPSSRLLRPQDVVVSSAFPSSANTMRGGNPNLSLPVVTSLSSLPSFASLSSPPPPMETSSTPSLVALTNHKPSSFEPLASPPEPSTFDLSSSKSFPNSSHFPSFQGNNTTFNSNDSAGNHDYNHHSASYTSTFHGGTATSRDSFLKDDGLTRFCVVCVTVCPARSRHCSACSRCVLTRDHHCPFLGTCVGIRNSRLFVQFLLLNFCLSAFGIVVALYYYMIYTPSIGIYPQSPHLKRSLVYFMLSIGLPIFGLYAFGVLLARFLFSMGNNISYNERVIFDALAKNNPDKQLLLKLSKESGLYMNNSSPVSRSTAMSSSSYTTSFPLEHSSSSSSISGVASLRLSPGEKMEIDRRRMALSFNKRLGPVLEWIANSALFLGLNPRTPAFLVVMYSFLIPPFEDIIQDILMEYDAWMMTRERYLPLSQIR